MAKFDAAAPKDAPELSASDWRQQALIARMELALLRQEKSTLEAIQIGLPEEAQALRERLAAIESSQSWRLTAPLRAFTTLLRRLRERLRGAQPASKAFISDPDNVMSERARRLVQHCEPAALQAWQDLLVKPGDEA